MRHSVGNHERDKRRQHPQREQRHEEQRRIPSSHPPDEPDGANACGDGGHLSGRAEQIQQIGHVTLLAPRATQRVRETNL